MLKLLSYINQVTEKSIYSLKENVSLKLWSREKKSQINTETKTLKKKLV